MWLQYCINKLHKVDRCTWYQKFSSRKARKEATLYLQWAKFVHYMHFLQTFCKKVFGSNQMSTKCFVWVSVSLISTLTMNLKIPHDWLGGIWTRIDNIMQPAMFQKTTYYLQETSENHHIDLHVSSTHLVRHQVQYLFTYVFGNHLHWVPSYLWYLPT